VSLRSRLLDHFRRALSWTREDGLDLPQALAAAFGMAGPVALAAALGHVEAGMAAATGALAVSGSGLGLSRRARRADLAWGLAAALLALGFGVLIAGHGPATRVALVALAGVAAVLGGLSRPAAVAATRFILFLVIATNLGEAGRPLALFILASQGALWTALLIVVFGRLSPRAPDIEEPPAPGLTLLARRWASQLRTWPAWRYPARITLCLALAEALAAAWPHHHGRWITLTVAILVRRQGVEALLMTTQRALGVFVGVLAAGLLVVWRPPLMALTLGVAVLAGARPLLRTRSYVAYSAVMTPLVILLLDLGAPPTTGLLADRMLATLAGALLVIATERPLGTPAPARPASSL